MGTLTSYGQWIGVEKDLSVIEPHTIYFVNNLWVVLIITVMKKETLRSMKNEFILFIFLIFKFKNKINLNKVVCSLF